MKHRSLLCTLIGVLLPGFAFAADVQNGHAVFDKWCWGCHAESIKYLPGTSLVGRVVAGTYTLEQLYKGRLPAALEKRTDLTPEFIKVTVRNGRNMMPKTRKTEISDKDLDDLAAYLSQMKP